MKIYVTRHGQTPWNVLGKVCGRADVELTLKGIEQAEMLAKQVSELGITKVLSSPLKRAYDTAKIVGEANEIPIEIEERLTEFDFGTYDGKQVDNQEFLMVRSQFPTKMPEGESLFQAAQRIYNLLDELSLDNDNIYLLVCHNAISRVIHSYFYNRTNKNFFEHQMNNCEYVGYEKS